jgi:hypothetical protein
VVLARALVSVVLSWLLLRRAGISPWGHRQGLLVGRGAIGSVALLCVYMASYRNADAGTDVTYLRHAFVCRALSHDPDRALDQPVVRALWMTPGEILDARARHRSPLVERTVADYLAGRRFPLDLIWTDPDTLRPRPEAGR